MRAKHALTLILFLLCSVFPGCGRFIHDSSPPPQQTQAESPGPPRVIFVLDTTATTSQYRGRIRRIAKLFLEELMGEGGVDLVLIRLDSNPQCVFQLDEAEHTDEFWKQFDKVFSQTTSTQGEGTDQVGAMNLVLDYSTPTEKIQKPSKIYLLYFSDMLVEQPKGRPGAFKTWDQFNWGRLKEKKIHAGFYFVLHKNPITGEPVIDRLTKMARKAGFKDAIWREPTDSNLISGGPVDLEKLFPP